VVEPVSAVVYLHTMPLPVVTGIGAVTPLGANFTATWDALLRKQSGLVVLGPEETGNSGVKIGGPVHGFDPAPYLTEKELQRWDPFMWYAVAASFMAVTDAGLTAEYLKDNPRVGLIIGSSRGGIRTFSRGMTRYGLPHRVSPFLMTSTTPFMATTACAMKLVLCGPSLGISSTCTSGTLALIEACAWIRSGRADLVVVGGSDAALCPAALSGYRAAGVLSKNENAHEASRPFDAERDGFVLSEGACVMILENPRHALERGARTYGSISGTGNTTSPVHETKPDAVSAARAITEALSQAGLHPEDIAAVNAHAPSTRLGDASEADALHRALGIRAGKVPTTANKSQTGHLLAASGVLEAALSLYALGSNIVPATLNHRTQDPRCALNVSTEHQALEGHHILSNSFGFGGSNAVLILSVPS